MSGDVEAIKLASEHLRGAIADELQQAAEPFGGDSTVLLKFHGIYQQDNRDVRRARTQAKEQLDYSCMVRAAVPGGVLSPAQWLALDSVAAVADGSLRLTTRQGVQYHGTPKGGLRQLIGTLNAELVTTLGACGDVVRNTMACPLPHADGRQHVLGPTVAAIATHFRPRTTAYWEIWINGEQAVSAHPQPAAVDVGGDEPIYGDVYLPRKFKIGLAWPGDNCIDVHSQDVGLVPTLNNGYDGEVTGWTVLVGGGLGQSHSRPDDTYPRLATPLGWVPPELLIPTIEAVVATQRDHGRRDDRHRARLKYLIDEQGSDWFRARVEDVLGTTLQPAPELLPWLENDEHHGWHELGDSTWALGVPIANGRLRDFTAAASSEDSPTDGEQDTPAADPFGGSPTPREALRQLLDRQLVTEIRVTARQDLLLTGIASDRRDEVVELLGEHGVVVADRLTPLQRLAIACPALPTCGQALGEAERVLPALVDDLDKALAAAGVGDQRIRLNMTGCPNGCARPYNSEIGIVGRTKRNYDVYVGGSSAGDRLATLLRADVPLSEIPALLAPVADRYAAERNADESFGDYCLRVGNESLEVSLPAPTVRRRAAREAVAEPVSS